MNISKIILLLLLVMSSYIYAFSPPFNIEDLDYNSFINAKEKDLILENGYLSLKKEVSYFGTTINYEVSINKNDENDFYIFFIRPVDKTEQFIEFFTDMLKWYSNKADIVVFNDYFDLKESQPTFTYYISTKRPIQFYRKESMTTGFRGFGISLTGADIYKKNEKSLINYCDPLKTPIKYISEFNPAEIKTSTIFISQTLQTDNIQIDIKEEDFTNNYYFVDFILKPNRYQLKIENWINKDSLDDYILYTNYYTRDSFSNIISDNEDRIGRESQLEYVAISCKKTEKTELDITFSIIKELE